MSDFYELFFEDAEVRKPGGWRGFVRLGMSGA
jgi:hypothetical protein